MRTSLVYDDAGRLSETVVRNGEEIIISKILNEYEADGDHIVATTTTSPTAGTESRVTFEYDESGNAVSVVTYNKLNQLVGRTTYDYEFYDEPSDTEQD